MISRNIFQVTFLSIDWRQINSCISTLHWVSQSLRSFFFKITWPEQVFWMNSDSNWDGVFALCWYIGEDHNLPIILARPTQLNTAILLQAIITLISSNRKFQDEVSRKIGEFLMISPSLSRLFADKNLEKQFFWLLFTVY